MRTTKHRLAVVTTALLAAVGLVAGPSSGVTRPGDPAPPRPVTQNAVSDSFSDTYAGRHTTSRIDAICLQAAHAVCPRGVVLGAGDTSFVGI